MIEASKSMDRPAPTRRIRALLCTGLFPAAAALATLPAAAEQRQSDQYERPSAAVQQTAFRVRSDNRQELNADAGWAAGPNEDASVDVDQPFRIRFELEHAGDATAEQVFQLQSRRNGGEWERVRAENFPQPEKVLELDNSLAASLAAGFDDVSETWRLDSGDDSNVSIVDDGRRAVFQVDAEQDPVIGLAVAETTWEAIELAGYVRFPQDGGHRAGLIFDYADTGNYKQLDVDVEGTVAVSRIDAGEKTQLVEVVTDVPHDRWLELKIIIEGENAIIEFDDDVLEFSVRFEDSIALTPVGFHVAGNNAGNSQAQFRDLVLEGEPATPRVSIIASETFQHREPTTDLLDGSSKPFAAGAGISFADRTPAWRSADSHGEWEFPLVIRRFADGAVTNDDGDTFEFRMVDARGKPVDSSRVPVITATVPPGHIGGTFVETPARVGPWQASSGDLYFPMEPSETYNVLMTVKSSDGGRTWREIDGDNRPKTDDLEGFASIHADGVIHMLHQTSDDVWYHAFNTSDHPTNPDVWAVQDERLASPIEPPTQVADIAIRSDGSIVGVYGGPDRIHYRIRSPEGAWSEETVIDADVAPNLSGPMMVSGAGDIVHLAYTGDDGTAWYRRILADGTLSPRELLASDLATGSEDIGAILPLVYLPETDTVSVIYRLQSGLLSERRRTAGGDWSEAVRVSDRPVVQNAVDSDQVGADAIAHGNTVHVLFIDEDSRSIFHARRKNNGQWTAPEPVVEGINAQWVRGMPVARNDSGTVYGFVYDAGSYGGSGMNRYATIELEKD